MSSALVGATKLAFLRTFEPKLNLYVGAFGEVRLCVHRETGAQRATKVLRKDKMGERDKSMLFNEINILKSLVRESSSIDTCVILSLVVHVGSPEHHQNVRVL